jgi:tetratricopeptide (TPR) repeat protein
MTVAGSSMPILELAGKLFSQGQLDASDSLLAQVSPADPAYAYALYLRAMMMAASGRDEERCALLEKAHSLCPTSRDMHVALARVYADLGRTDEALALLSRLVDAGGITAAIALDRGTLARRLGKARLAMECYDTALALDPGLADAWTCKGNLLHEDGRYAEALRCHDAAVAANPKHVPAIYNRTATLNRLGQLQEALAEGRRALTLAPDDPDAWTACGCTLALMASLEEAMQCFDQAWQINPQHRHALANRASTLAELGQHQQALDLFEAALSLAQGHPSDMATLRTKQGMLQLMMGDWAGWSGYEYRTRIDRSASLHDVYAPRWSGSESLAGKSILLWSEQGFGDTIQFCRYAACLKERGAIVMLEVPASLLSLCGQLPAASIHVRGEPLPPHDFQIPMMSMPLALGNNREIPYPHGYLRAPDAHVQKWAAALPPRSSRPRIGIVCSGSLHHQRNAARSIPLAAFEPLTAHAELIVLQPELTQQDNCTLENISGLLKPAVDINDFADVAGLIANTDLVISVDTAIAHLAGALGHPLWLLLPWQAEWRWMTQRGDTPWYATACLYRQANRGCWESDIARVRRAIADKFP